FRAFKIAVSALLDRIEEPGANDIPMEYERREAIIAETGDALDMSGAWFAMMQAVWKSPDSLAAYELEELWKGMHRTEPLSAAEHVKILKGAREGQAIEEDFYALPKAWKALELKSTKRKSR